MKQICAVGFLGHKLSWKLQANFLNSLKSVHLSMKTVMKTHKLLMLLWEDETLHVHKTVQGFNLQPL